jgi:methylglutaconyl-CoA hydratase
MNESLLLHQVIEPSVTLLTLNRPEKRNALNIPLLQALNTALEDIKLDKNQRVVILSASGSVFCAGLDLSEASQIETEKESATLLAHVFSSIAQMPQIMICAVQGAALAGGAGLACVFDYVLAVQEARFGFPEVRRGLVAAQVTAILRRQLKERQIRELLLFGESISSEEALKIGLINRVVGKEELLARALEIAKLAMQGAPGAIQQTKTLIDALSLRSMEDDLEITMEFHHAARHSDEAQEGMHAFLEKRKPSWDRSNLYSTKERD